MSTALVRACLVARAHGGDFPTIWQTVLRDHPLVAGRPIQTLKHERPHLEIPLVTGFWLVHDSDRNEYTLEPDLPRSRAPATGEVIPIDRGRRLVR